MPSVNSPNWNQVLYKKINSSTHLLHRLIPDVSDISFINTVCIFKIIQPAMTCSDRCIRKLFSHSLSMWTLKDALDFTIAKFYSVSSMWPWTLTYESVSLPGILTQMWFPSGDTSGFLKHASCLLTPKHIHSH